MNVCKTDEEVVKKVWSAYGTQDPYFSVLTEDKFHKEHIAEHEAEFWDTGNKSIQILKNIYEEYHTHTKTEKPRVLDYGCGVGRLMKAWGVGCEGCDISPAHLEIAKDKLDSTHPLHLVEPGECPQGYDVIFSLIVLQHNRPELMKKCVKSIVEALNPDGLAMLHAPYFIETVHQSDTVMEMNYLTKDDFVKTVEESGGKVIAYNEKYDLCGGGIKNCIYVISKSQKSIFKRMLNHIEPEHWSDIHPSGTILPETKDKDVVE
jgi:2-polyprenyl-3-methyl-5-hydroxy-6-metoxy-1,4-benzoquinol methylase